jgi:hypothetical protein
MTAEADDAAMADPTPATPAVMGRFFVTADALFRRGEMSWQALIEMRNALYGPTVPPLDWRRYVDHLDLLNEWHRHS